MNYQQTLDYLFSTLPMYQRIGAQAYKKDLTNTLKLCELLGQPHQKFKSVHIAGTNGKGSSAHMLAAILQVAGYTTGLYTSPHLKSFTERIKINGVEIEEEAVVRFVSNNRRHLESIKPSFFETTVAMAFDYFAVKGVDIAIIETGLGGRLDSTNVITPLVSLITNIGYDHQQMLGETLAEIAGEKAGIIKKRVPVVISERQDDIADVFIRKTDAEDAPIIFASEEIDDERVSAYELDLKGMYQYNNVRGVLQVINELRTVGYDIAPESIKEGIENTIKLTGLKGRWQTLGTSPLTLCDTAHNAEGVQVVFGQIKTLAYTKLHIVWGMVNDKDISKVLLLLPKEAQYYFCKPNVPRGLDATLLFERASALGLRGTVIDDVCEAIEMAKKSASRNDMIYIGGSTFVVAEIPDL